MDDQQELLPDSRDLPPDTPVKVTIDVHPRCLQILKDLSPILHRPPSALIFGAVFVDGERSFPTYTHVSGHGMLLIPLQHELDEEVNEVVVALREESAERRKKVADSGLGMDGIPDEL